MKHFDLYIRFLVWDALDYHWLVTKVNVLEAAPCFVEKNMMMMGGQSFKKHVLNFSFLKLAHVLFSVLFLWIGVDLPNTVLLFFW